MPPSGHRWDIADTTLWISTLRRIKRHRNVVRYGEIETIGSRDGVQDDRAVLDAPAHGPILSRELPAVITPARLTRPNVGRSPTIHNAQPEQYRPAGIRSDGERDEAGRRRGCGSGRQSTRSLLRIPGIVGPAASPLIAESELTRRELGDKHRARILQPFHHRRVVIERLRVEHTCSTSVSDSLWPR